MKEILDLINDYFNGSFSVFTATTQFIDYLLTIKRPMALPFPIEITPHVAQYIINGHNDYNRKFTPGTCSSYAKQMENNEWTLNGETIVFLTNNQLGDGQHRLGACIKCGLPIKTMIVCGIDSNVMTTMDSGKQRSNADAMSLFSQNGDKDTLLAKIVTTAINNLSAHYAEHGSSSTRTTAVTKTQLENFYMQHKDLCEEIKDKVKSWKNDIKKAPFISDKEIGGFAIYFILKGCPKDLVLEYFSIFISGRWGNTVLTKSVYDKLVNTNKREMTLRAQYLIKGWNGFVSGILDKAIRKTESIPALVVPTF